MLTVRSPAISNRSGRSERTEIARDRITSHLLKTASRKFRSRIAHEARSPPPRQPALARHSPHLTSHRSSRPTSPCTALRKRSPVQHTPHPRLPCTALHKQPAHCAHSSAFAQHILPSHRMSSLLCASPSPGPCPPSPDCGYAPPPPPCRPTLPVSMCAVCSAYSSCARAESAFVARRPQPHRPGLPRSTSWQPHSLARSASGAGILVPRRP